MSIDLTVSLAPSAGRPQPRRHCQATTISTSIIAAGGRRDTGQQDSDATRPEMVASPDQADWTGRTFTRIFEIAVFADSRASSCVAAQAIAMATRSHELRMS